ncbi:metallophosphoesterase [Actinoplanes sp. HUAS TT8]|uniref:metallophosphoesterase n=1 Tax=Actinoplanes sp. HUAS TT8 TaxID=3447453 RepID=UPI003F521EE5
MRLLHLSDTHLTREAEPNPYGIDPAESLRRILRDCSELPGVDAILVSGDVADDGTPEAYAQAFELIGNREVPAFFTTGNHDERGAFAAVLGCGHPKPVAEFDGPERAAVSLIEGYRLVTLDSLIPGKTYGRISARQLDWLREILTEPAPEGTVVAFHHPPVIVPGHRVQEWAGLRNGDELAAVLTGTDVRLILCGHFHLQLFGMFAGAPLWVTPGVVNRIDLTGTPGVDRFVKGASATLIDLGGPHSPVLHTLHARDPEMGRTAYEVDFREVSLSD